MATLRERICAFFHPPPPRVDRRSGKDLLPPDVREQSHGLHNDLARMHSKTRELKRQNRRLLDENLDGLFNQLRGVEPRQ